MDDIDKQLIDLNKAATKKLEKIKKDLVKDLKELDENFSKFRTALVDLKDFTDKIAEDPEKYSSKGKLWFKSLNALADFTKYADHRSTEFAPPDYTSVDFTYDELKQFGRNFSSMLNDIDKELSRANQIMGIDFSLKKRSATTPFGKLKKIRNDLRDMLQGDYRLIKVLEDSEKVKQEIKDLRNEISRTEKDEEELVTIITAKESLLDELAQQIKYKENDSNYAVVREKKVDGEKERLEIGTKINPLKKTFRLLVNKSREIDINFAAVGAGQVYEKDVMEAFMKDAPEFRQLKILLETLVEKQNELKIKKNVVVKCENLLNSINSQNLAKRYQELMKYLEEIAELEKNPKILEIVNEIEELKNKIDNTTREVELSKEREELISNKLEESQKSHEERLSRFEELLKDGNELITAK
ncbi:MAG: hypothetical protein ACFFD4_22320 [Candidatus Odinarchaeota archaeon]